MLSMQTSFPCNTYNLQPFSRVKNKAIHNKLITLWFCQFLTYFFQNFISFFFNFIFFLQYFKHFSIVIHLPFIYILKAFTELFMRCLSFLLSFYNRSIGIFYTYKRNKLLWKHWKNENNFVSNLKNMTLCYFFRSKPFHRSILF